ncbi:MAG: hypothetical protein ACRDI2_24265 [Chloroflexota bacterium]
MDTAKQVFHLVGVDARGEFVWRRKVSRAKLLETLARLEPCVVALEACAASHHWGRCIQELGHTVKLLAPKLVKPYRRGQENDYRDAEAIVSATLAPGMHFVGIKTVEQQAEQALHRLRSRLQSHRNAAANGLRELRGVGVLSASALRVKVAFRGFPPGHRGTGGQVTIGKTKPGHDRYLRQLMIHGARSALRHLGDKQDARSRWMRAMVQRRGFNIAAVALAHKNARQAWAILARQQGALQ